MPWIDIEQNTDEWLDLRLGKVTGSTIGKIMANYGKAFGDPAKNLAVNLSIEQITGVRQGSDYSNSDMQRGHVQEPLARACYEDEYFVDVTNGGFYDNIITGCSPDGLVLDDGLIEIKSSIATIHYERRRKGGFDPQYKWQLIFNLKESDRDWIDFVSYCQAYPVKTRIYVHRLSVNNFKDEYDMIDTRLNEFFEFMKHVKDRIENG